MFELDATYAEDIVDTLREPLLVLDEGLRVRSANRAFYRAFQVSRTDTEGQLVYRLGNGQWDSPALRTLLETIIPANSSFDGFELAHDFPAIGPRVMVLNARRMRPGPHAGFLVLAMEDVTELRQAAEVVARAAADVAEAHRRMSEDLRAAARVQAAYLPDVPPAVAGAAFAWAYRPCAELGGDGLNVIPLGAGQVRLFVLDASGHGVSAALLAVSIGRVLSPPPGPPSILGAAAEPATPAAVAARLNELFPFDMATHQFATLVYGILDVPRREFRFVAAGHPGPVHQPAGGEPVVLDHPGYPVGLAEGPYTDQLVRLATGDRLYLYSDGVTEAMSPDGHLFGIGRFLAAIARVRSMPLAAAASALRADVEQWSGPAGPPDDVSIVAVELSPPHGG